MRATTPATAVPPATATCRACAARPSTSRNWPAPWRTEALRSLMLDTVCCSVDACCSVRDDRSPLPLAISAMLEATALERSRTSPTTPARCCFISSMAVFSRPTSSSTRAGAGADRSPAAMRCAASSACCSGTRVARRISTNAARITPTPSRLITSAAVLTKPAASATSGPNRSEAASTQSRSGLSRTARAGVTVERRIGLDQRAHAVVAHHGLSRQRDHVAETQQLEGPAFHREELDVHAAGDRFRIREQRHQLRAFQPGRPGGAVLHTLQAGGHLRHQGQVVSLEVMEKRCLAQQAHPQHQRERHHHHRGQTDRELVAQRHRGHGHRSPANRSADKGAPAPNEDPVVPYRPFETRP